MAKHLRNTHNRLRSIRDAQVQVPFERGASSLVETACLKGEFTPQQGKATEIVEGIEQIWRPAGLEI